MTGRYMEMNGVHDWVIHETERDTWLGDTWKRKGYMKGKDTNYKATSPAKAHEEYMMGNRRRKYTMGRLENIIALITSPLTVLAPKRHEVFSFTAKVDLFPPTTTSKASNCLPEATFMRTFRIIWVVIVQRTVIVSPHGHILLGFTIFVRGLEGSDAPALQSSHCAKATVLEDVSLSVNPEVHFANLSRAEPNTLLRSDLVRIGSTKDARRRVGTAADDRFASVCKSGIQISTGYTFRVSEEGTMRHCRL